MLAHGVTAAQHAGTAPDTAEELDVAQLLLAAVRRGRPPTVASVDGDEVPVKA
jgi:hypothetical protein